jgi:hypothetical protein
MKITDIRNKHEQVLEYKLGQVFNDGDYTYMVTANREGSNYQLTQLPDGVALSSSESSLENLYEATDHYGEQLIDAELIIRGVSQ